MNRLINTSGKAKPLQKPKELKHLLFVASQGDLGIRNVAIIWMLFGSGMRINEVAHLRVKDVLQKNGELHDFFILPAAYTKTNTARIVYLMVESQRNALYNWIKHRQETEGMLSGKLPYGGLRPNSGLFLSKKGRWREFAFNDKKYKTLDGVKTTKVCSSMENLVRGIIKSAGFKDSSSHTGRSTIATWFDRCNVDLNVIQNILNHKSDEMTLEYIEPDQQRVRAAFKVLLSEIKI